MTTFDGHDEPMVVTAGRAVCGAKKRQGEGFCTQPAGWGTDHTGFGRCKLHGGRTPTQSKRAAVLAVQAAHSAAGHFGQQLTIDPHEALLTLVREAYGNVTFLRSLVQELESGARLVAGDFGADDLAADTKTGDDARVAELDDLVDAAPSRRASIAGRVDWESLKAAPHVLVVMYGDWCDRLARYSRTAIESGVREREIELAERQGQMIAAVIRGVLADLGLSRQQRDLAPALVRRHLSAIAVHAEVRP